MNQAGYRLQPATHHSHPTDYLHGEPRHCVSALSIMMFPTANSMYLRQCVEGNSSCFDEGWECDSHFQLI